MKGREKRKKKRKTREIKDEWEEKIRDRTYYYHYKFSITHSLFHSRLKTFLFCKSFQLQRCLPFSSSGLTTWIPQTVYCYF